jgi:hypothetical protein
VEKNSTDFALIAPDDLADPRMIQADQLADFTKREAILLGLGESLAACLTRGFAIALELFLGCRDRFTGGLAFGVVGHHGKMKPIRQTVPVRGRAYGPMITLTPKPSSGGKLTLRDLPRVAFEGAIGNAAWALVLIAAVVFAALLNGHVALWLFAVVLLLMLGISGFISTALLRQTEQLRGARDEARQQANDANQRALQLEEQADAEKRELREQLAAASGGQQVVSTRMQSIARQADALASTETGYAYGPDPSQVALLLGLLEGFQGLAPNDDPVLAKLLATWREPLSEHGNAAWNSALQVLKARALSLGAEEALGQR